MGCWGNDIGVVRKFMDVFVFLIGMMEMLLLLMVEEVVVVLWIGCLFVYWMVHEYLVMGGMVGMLVFWFGFCLWVPRWALLELVVIGCVVWLCDVVVTRVEV